MTYISIVIPTRNRPQLLDRCIKSIIDTSDHIDQIEIIVLADDDDTETLAYIDNQQETLSKYQIRFIVRPQGDTMIEYYVNYGSSIASGDWIWVLNDECAITTQHWDTIIRDIIEPQLHEDRLAYISIYDDVHTSDGGDTHTDWRNKNMLASHGCCFPILSKESIQAVGCNMPREIEFWGADSALFRLYKKLKDNRIITCMEIVLDTLSIHNGKRPEDYGVSRANIMSKHYQLSPQEEASYVNLLNESMTNV